MTVESASFISGLVPAYPPGSDSISEGDDHLRLLKNVLQGTFPNANAAINGIHTGTSAPTAKTAGTIWYDTTASNKVLKIYNGSGWTTLSTSPETDFKLLGATNVGWVLPTADGIAGQYLKTDASGNLDWATIVSPATVNFKDITHKIEGNQAWRFADDTYGNSGFTVTHTKLSATSTLFVTFQGYVNAASNFTAGVTTFLGHWRLGDNTGSVGTLIPNTTDNIVTLFFDDVGEGAGITWDMSSGICRTWRVATGDCPGGTTGDSIFTIQVKQNEYDNSSWSGLGTWTVMEIEE